MMRTLVALALLATSLGCNAPKEGTGKPARHAKEPPRASAHKTGTRGALHESQRNRTPKPLRLIERMPTRQECKSATRFFVAPKVPRINKRVRVLATIDSEPLQHTLQVWRGDGTPVKPDSTLTLGGPPHAKMVVIDSPGAEHLTVALGKDGNVLACTQFGLSNKGSAKSSGNTAVWANTQAWSKPNEALWSFFVESLFDYPVDDTRTWTNLHDLVRDQDRNFLYDYLGQNEDESLTLEPDCADLPYQLRAYFSWKLGLPFGFRWCSRGAVGRPPTCGPLRGNTISRERSSDAGAFEHFAQRVVRPGVHSASGRTHPKDDQSDLYPVALKRASLSPGTVYADPYGHVMVLTKWVPQQADESGVLMAAEAQPDGTVGRRRFWRGSFLFDPDTTHVGAGFKHFRPITEERGKLKSLDNGALQTGQRFSSFSLEQYEITRDQFYDRMDALINPEPLNPEKRLLALIDAFDESVQRRVTAVQNGEDYVQEHGTIDMPHGHAVFETTGPWEDYSSPSRDMRLLISLDTVTGFIDRVRRHPARFGVQQEKLKEVVSDLGGFLRKELEKRSISYTRSDGKEQRLTLWQIVQRAGELEMAYNPNDCIEVRWAAPPDSSEHSACKRHAPNEQRERMKRYRVWFKGRTRPARGTE